jgi:hypothetical protein
MDGQQRAHHGHHGHLLYSTEHVASVSAPRLLPCRVATSSQSSGTLLRILMRGSPCPPAGNCERDRSIKWPSLRTHGILLGPHHGPVADGGYKNSCMGHLSIEHRASQQKSPLISDGPGQSPSRATRLHLRALVTACTSDPPSIRSIYIFTCISSRSVSIRPWPPPDPASSIRIALNRLAVAASIIITFFNHIFHSRALAGQATLEFNPSCPGIFATRTAFPSDLIFTYFHFCSTFFLEL